MSNPTEQFPAPWSFSRGYLVCMVDGQERCLMPVPAEAMHRDLVYFMAGCVNAVSLHGCLLAVGSVAHDMKRFTLHLSDRRVAIVDVPLRMSAPERDRLRDELQRLSMSLETVTVDEVPEVPGVSVDDRT